VANVQDQRSKVKGQGCGVKGQGQRKLMYQQQKRYNTAMDRFSDFKLGMTSWQEYGKYFCQCLLKSFH